MMKFIGLWELIGKQPLTHMRCNDVKVFVGKKEYRLKGIRYVDGVAKGLEVEEGISNEDNREQQ